MTNTILSAWKSFFLQTPWGEKSLAALCISVLSGIIIALQYDPTAPFYSVSAMDIMVPFGSFWRALHFYSSQLFFLLAILHLTAILLGRNADLQLLPWIYLISGLGVALLLLFSGYVLRGDATGEYAGAIAENILISIPLIGNGLNDLLFSISTDGLKRVYPNHLIGLGILWGFLSWNHLKRYRIRWARQTWITLFLLIICVFFTGPLEPETLGQLFVPGPWFMLGLQELLRYLQPFWAGVLFPLSFFAALCLIPIKKFRAWTFGYTALWLTLYAILSAIGYWRG